MTTSTDSRCEAQMIACRGTRRGVGRRWVAIGALAMILNACAGSSQPAPEPTVNTLVSGLEAAGPPPALDLDKVRVGEELYLRVCASCHMTDLSGEPDWKTPNADGTYRAPPHDASGHTWHHSDQLLLSIVRDGVEGIETSMPTYADILTDDEIVSIIEYLKSSWPTQERTFQWQVTWQESQRDDSTGR